MKKKLLIAILSHILAFSLLTPISVTKVEAYTAQCSGYWVGMVDDATHVKLIKCVDSYSDGVELMKQQTSTADNVATVFNGNTIVASMYATLDFTTVGSSSVNSYLYAVKDNGTVVSSSDYFNGYYTAEGPFILTGSSSTKAVTMVSGLKGRINKTRSSYTQYEIVPISVKAPLNYYVANAKGDLTHYFAYFSSQSSIVIGKAPSFMKTSTKYYSYDGHYFYTSFTQMIDDLNASSHSKAINADEPWYNYYQYVPFHSSTNYTAADIDSYMRARGYDQIAYTYYNKQMNGQSTYPLKDESLMYGTGSYFMQMQQIYGINPMLLIAIGANESSWGRSYISIVKNNLFGMAAYDSSTSSARAYDCTLDSVLDVARTLTGSYFNAKSESNFYNGALLGNKESGVNVRYASDAYWGEKAAAYYYAIDKYLGFKDYNYYTIGVTNKESVQAYNSASTSSKAYMYNGTNRVLKNNSVLIVGESGNYYKVMADGPLSSSNSWTSGGNTTQYDLENNYVYVKKSDITVVNKQSTYQKPKNSEAINAIRIELLEERYTLEATQDAPLYYDAYGLQKAGVTVKKGAVLVAVERAYDCNGDTMYKVVYESSTGKQEWIKANQVKEITASYAIKNNTTHDAIGSDVYASTDTSNKVSTVKYNGQPIAIIESKTVGSTVWYKICYNAVTGATGWTKASGYGKAVTHTAPEKPVDPVDPDPVNPPTVDPDDPDDPDVVLQEKSGMWFLHQLQANSDNTALTIRGLLAIEGITNSASTDLTFVLQLINQVTGNVIEIPMQRWTDTKSYPYDVNNVPGVKHDYSGAWFEGTLDFQNIPSGDYTAYVVVRGTKYYARQILSNSYSISMDQRITNSQGTGIELRTNYLLKALPIDIIIREQGLLSPQAKTAFDNAFIEYTRIGLADGKLSVRGTAFSIGASYPAKADIKRSLVLENITTFERTTFDIGSISNGDYKIVLRVDDKQDKTRAWFDSSVDISDLAPGTYAIYIVSESANGILDYGELADPFFRELKATMTVSYKTYSLSVNPNKRYRIELTVK